MISSTTMSHRHRSSPSSRRRLSIDALASRCQKPEYQRIGNWMARRIARPLALRITWAIQLWPITANTVTLTAWLVALAAAVGFATGNVYGWVFGAVALQAWYILDHVDGQLARLRGSASLDGVQLDYLMHHSMHLLIPLTVGWGVFVQSQHVLWAALGLAWAMGLSLLGWQHDTAYKAFIQRLKRLKGRLWVEGGGGGRPGPQPPIPRDATGLLKWSGRKLCEMHVVMNLLLAVAIAQWWLGDEHLRLGAMVLAVLGPLSAIAAVVALMRSQRNRAVEAEFAAWYRPEEATYLHFDRGWWYVVPGENSEDTQPAACSRQSAWQSP